MLECTAPKLPRPGTKARLAHDDREAALARLRILLPPGSTVWTILRHRASSGMFRRITLIASTFDGPRDIDRLCQRVGLGTLKDGNPGLGVKGCGMDMGFHLVYTLSHMLYPPGTPGSALQHRWL